MRYKKILLVKLIVYQMWKKSLQTSPIYKYKVIQNCLTPTLIQPQITTQSYLYTMYKYKVIQNCLTPILIQPQITTQSYLYTSTKLYRIVYNSHPNIATDNNTELPIYKYKVIQNCLTPILIQPQITTQSYLYTSTKLYRIV